LIRATFFFMVAALGAMALVSQIILLRQLMVAFYGSEMIVALVMAGWLTGVFIGARAAGILSLAGRPLKAALFVFPLAWITVLACLLAWSYAIPRLTGLAPGEVAPLGLVTWWTALFTLPAGLFVGALFVLVGSRYSEMLPPTGPARLGVGAAVFWMETAGSTLGLLVYTFWLVGRCGPVASLSLLAGVVILGMALALPRLPSSKISWSALVAGLALVVLWSGLPGRLDQAGDAHRFAGSHPEYRLLAARDTPYQHLALADRGGEYALFGNQVFLGSWPDPYQYQVLTLFFLTEAAASDRVLLAGQGPGAFIHEFLARGVEQLVYVALDAEETGLVRAHLPPDMDRDFDDPRLTVIHDDLRHYLGSTSDTFDLMVINAPDPDNAQINRLYTLEFFQAAARRLSPQGILVTSISGADNYWGDELVSYGRSLLGTMNRVFPEVLVTPGDRNYFLAGARPGLVTNHPEVLAERYRTRGYDSRYMTPRSFLMFFPPTAVAYLKDRLSGANQAPLNTDAAPLSFYLRLIWWEKMTGRPWIRSLLQSAIEVWTWGPAALVLMLLPSVLIFFRPRPIRTAWWTVLTTGLMTMALQIILILLFQNRYGILYRQIGLLSALFMAGLTGGGLLGRLAVGTGAGPRLLLPVLELLLGVTAALAALTAWGRLPDLILPLTGLTGLISGFEFALLFALYLQDRSQPTVVKALSRLEAADHGGAVVGALVTGLILAPLVGLGLTAALLALLKTVNALVLLRPYPNPSS
jgi:spermidine synthase